MFFLTTLGISYEIAHTIHWICLCAYLVVLRSGSDVSGSLCILPCVLKDVVHLLGMYLNRLFIAHNWDLTFSPHFIGGRCFLAKQHPDRGEPGCLKRHQPVRHDG